MSEFFNNYLNNLFLKNPSFYKLIYVSNKKNLYIIMIKKKKNVKV